MITVNWSTKVIDSTASILDLSVFHATLRDLEDDATGAIYPVTHTWKALDLGGGAFMYGLDLINGYTLRFPNAGNYTVAGNLGGSIVPVAGVYVERKTSAAYSTTAVGGSGPTAADIAAAVRANLAVELARLDTAISTRTTGTVPADVRYVNGTAVKGNGQVGNEWGPV